jgi:hypothetical protein
VSCPSAATGEISLGENPRMLERASPWRSHLLCGELNGRACGQPFIVSDGLEPDNSPAIDAEACFNPPSLPPLGKGGWWGREYAPTPPTKRRCCNRI